MAKPEGNDARADRLALKLKENLKRRKAQARARAGAGAAPDPKKDAKDGKLSAKEQGR